MKRYTLPYIICILFIFVFSSCRQDGPAPIRNIKGGPKLLRAQTNSACQTYTYSQDQKQKSLGMVFTREVLVSFKDGLTSAQQQQSLAAYDFVKQQKAKVLDNSAQLYRLELVAGLNCSQVEEALHLLADNPDVSYASPLFMQGDQLLGLTNELTVTIEEGGENALQQLADQYNAEVLPALTEHIYVLRLNKNATSDALALAEFLQGESGIVRANADFVRTKN
ncbi:hypothetical protein MKJ04_07125 [Pontibacter sp. E15-1]|uniref:S8 family serine peptidase n=1 Tax=Pontibacter sp. E15-1 TaxID=2919918 RepID=UPI001F4FB72E|nr:hypothetical protein [Pontibacter sp. E15-1]MCJ8164612.1 hypothetical protein [Pontibacter sp. E15-1]